MSKRQVCLVLAGIMLMLTGCAAATRLVDYGKMQTDVKMSESVFLTPTDQKIIYIETKNTSSNQNITTHLDSIIRNRVQSKGYQVVQKPGVQKPGEGIILQTNIKYIGEWKEGMGFEGTLTGAGLGALAGIGLSPHHYRYHHGAGAAVVGGLIGAGVGLVVDLATRVKTAIIVVEIQITERLSKEEDITGDVRKTELILERKVLGGMGTELDMPTTKVIERQVSSKPGVKVHNVAVAAKAAQVGLNIEEATGYLIEVAGMQIAGIF